VAPPGLPRTSDGPLPPRSRVADVRAARCRGQTSCARLRPERLRKGWHGRLETLRWLDVLREAVEAEALDTAYSRGIQRFAELIG
jgi:hypothetical protein